MIPDDLAFALETIEDPLKQQLIIEKWDELTDGDKSLVLMALRLNATQDFLYNKRLKQLGI
jgi:hypothetical protein